MTKRKCEICGALNRPLSSFIYDSEYSYYYYKTDSVKPYISKLECIECHKRQHSNDWCVPNDIGHRMYPIQKENEAYKTHGSWASPKLYHEIVSFLNAVASSFNMIFPLSVFSKHRRCLTTCCNSKHSPFFRWGRLYHILDISIRCHIFILILCYEIWKLSRDFHLIQWIKRIEVFVW